MESDKETIDLLKDMGFNEDIVRTAMSKCATTDVATIIEYIEKSQLPQSENSKNSAYEVSEDVAEQTDSSKLSTQASAEGDNLSLIKCIQCNCLFGKKGASRHAESTGHDQFEEASEIEKLDRIRLMKDKLVEKKKQEDLEREKKRRTNGRQMGSLRLEMRQIEMQKMAEERVRDKKMDILHRQRVKDQIKADRQTMKDRNPGQNVTPVESSIPVKKPVSSAENCKIMVRIGDGRCITNTFKRTEPLSAVRLWVQLNHPDGPIDHAQLVQAYPKKIFTEEEMQLSILDLNIGTSHAFMLR